MLYGQFHRSLTETDVLPLAVSPIALRPSLLRAYSAKTLPALTTGSPPENPVTKKPSSLRYVPGDTRKETSNMFSTLFSHTQAHRPEGIEMVAGDFDITPPSSNRPSLEISCNNDEVPGTTKKPSTIPVTDSRKVLLKTSGSYPKMEKKGVSTPPIQRPTVSTKMAC